MPGVLSYVLLIIGYALLYTGLSDFSGHNIGLFQAFGYTGSKGPSIDTSQYQYKNPVANMSGQPAQPAASTGIGGVKPV